MRLDVAGHFAEVKQLARECDAESLSIQSHWTFVNFANVADAERFLGLAMNKGWVNAHGVNTQRPLKVAEVAIQHPR